MFSFLLFLFLPFKWRAHAGEAAEEPNLPLKKKIAHTWHVDRECFGDVEASYLVIERVV